MAAQPSAAANHADPGNIVLVVDTTQFAHAADARRLREQLRELATPTAFRDLEHAFANTKRTVTAILQPLSPEGLSLAFLDENHKLSRHALERLRSACEQADIIKGRTRVVAFLPPGRRDSITRDIRHWFDFTASTFIDDCGTAYRGTIKPAVTLPVREWALELANIAVNVAEALGYKDVDRKLLTALSLAPRLHVWIGDLHLCVNRTIIAPPAPVRDGPPGDSIARIAIDIEIPRRRAWFGINVTGGIRQDPAADSHPDLPDIPDLHLSLSGRTADYALRASPPLPGSEATALLDAALAGAFKDNPIHLHHTEFRPLPIIGYTAPSFDHGETTSLCGTLHLGSGGLDDIQRHYADVAARAARAEADLAVANTRHADQLSDLEDAHAAQIAVLKATIERERSRAITAPPPAAAPQPPADALLRLRGQTQHWRLRLEQLAQASRNIRVERDELRGEVWRLRQALRIKDAGDTAAPPGAGGPTPLERLDLLEEWCKTNLSPAITLTRRALRAAAKSVFNDPERIGRCLLALDTLYAPMCFDNDPEARAAWEQFLRHEAVECGPTGAAVDDHRTWDTYRVTHQGRRLTLDRHIQGNGGTRDKTRQFRIYFATDTTSRVLVVGHLPEHLPNRLS